MPLFDVPPLHNEDASFELSVLQNNLYTIVPVDQPVISKSVKANPEVVVFALYVCANA